jgi:hypothetical protein
MLRPDLGSSRVVTNPMARIAGFAAALVATASVYAAPLASFEVSDVPTNGKTDVGTVAPGISSAAPSGVLSSFESFDFGGGRIIVRGENLSPTLSGAIDQQDYVSFTVTPTSGNEIDFTDIVARLGSQDRTREAYLLSSATGFTAANSLASTTLLFNGSSAFGEVTANYDLTGVAALQNRTAATEFRIYFTDANSAGGNFQYVGVVNRGFGQNVEADLIVNGEVSPVPEPTTLALVGFGALVLGRRRRA